MWDYILVLSSVALLALGFIIQKIYQKGSKSSNESSIMFSIISACCSIVVLILLNGFSFDITWYSAINSVLRALCGLLYTILGFQIMREGKIAFYMLFLMSGGMLVPAVWGWIFLGEEVKPLHVIGVAVIVASIVLSNSGTSRPTTKTLLKCCVVFVLNGFASVFSKLHQVNTAYASVGTTEYAMLGTVASLLMSIALLSVLVAKNHTQSELRTHFRWRTLLLVPLYSAIGTVSSLLQLEGARNLPASVLYPMITGGTIVLTGLFALLFFGEKLSRRGWIGIFLCLGGTCLFLA
ncbi:MAG: DMT family transporter [Clostridia bacterium]|nr:DMT family transporter [Clostridia bacterium]